MTATTRPSREMGRRGQMVRELLAGRQCSIDYHQREYKRRQKQFAELVDDLSAKVLGSYEEGNERCAVADYVHYYFLGSFTISDNSGQKVISDGQQRLTTHK